MWFKDMIPLCLKNAFIRSGLLRGHPLRRQGKCNSSDGFNRIGAKVASLLESPIYKRVERDPTAATERKVLKEVKDLEKKELILRNLGLCKTEALSKYFP